MTHLFLLSSSPINYSKPQLNPRNTPNPNFQFLSFSSSNRRTIPAVRFDFDDGSRRNNRRNWWSDDDDSDDDDDDDYQFFSREDPNPIDWVSKVLGMFGWMVPAVIISSLLGTGTNSLVMALVVPLGQTALSLVIDRIAGGPNPRSYSSPRSKSRPRPRSRPRKKTSVNNQRNTEARGEVYQSWRTTNNSSKMNGESELRFGGWDELDEQVGSSSSFSREGQSREVNGLRREDSGSGKLSATRNRDKPLFMRLLIAVFPLLGSWTRFLF